MILFQSEDSWEIKYLGINLLYKLIKLFSNIKDSRTDDDSLLIQQYEVQIFSCIKNIFNSKSKVPPNFKSIKKGFNLIYLFLTISISNDIEYIQKFNEYIHFMDFIENKYTEKKEIKFGNNNFNFSSEKEENIIKYQFFILLCRLFVSCYTKKDFNIKYIQKIKEIKTIEIHSSFMAEEIKNYFKEKFREKAFNFCDNLKHYIYLMFESFVQQKDDDNDLNTNLYYSNKLRLKYASLFLTVISIILHNNLIKNLNTSIIIVADGGLGTINSTVLPVEYARQYNIGIEGIILNNFEPESFMHQDNLKQVEYLTGIKVIAAVEKNQKDINLLQQYFQ